MSDNDNRQQGGYRRSFMRQRRKVCHFCANQSLIIDYKNIDLLARFVTDKGKIVPRRVTGTCARHQRDVALEIKRAREIALLPFVVR
jgi:small subunit ribosomal protein S18